MSDKLTWSLRPIDATESHVVCRRGDVSVHISEDGMDFRLVKRIKGIWVRADNPLWTDLPSAMAEAERICKGGST